MYDHIGLKVRDLDASVRFYTAALGALGHELASRDDSGAGLGPRGAPALWLYATPGKQAAGTHVALRATSRAQVDRFHAEGLKAGGRDNGRPGPAHGLQPELLRGVPHRSGRQQRRSGLDGIAEPPASSRVMVP